jgi:hypothetical protein
MIGLPYHHCLAELVDICLPTGIIGRIRSSAHRDDDEACQDTDYGYYDEQFYESKSLFIHMIIDIY